MIKKGAKKELSARSILFRFELLVFVPLLLLIVVFLLYGNRIYRERILRDTRTTIGYFLAEQQEKMLNIEHTLSNIVANDYSFQHLAYVNNTTAAYGDVYSVKEKFRAIMDNVGIIDGLGVYANNRISYYYATFQQGTDWSEHSAVRSFITEQGDRELPPPGGWMLHRLGGQWYLINIFGYNRVYCFCVIRAGSLSLHNEEESSYILLAGGQELLSFPELREKWGVRPDEQAESYVSRQGYYIVQEPFDTIDCRIIYAAPDKGILDWRSGFLFAVLMLLVFGAVLVAGQGYLRRNIVTEAEQMIRMVARAREGAESSPAGNKEPAEEKQQVKKNPTLQEYRMVEQAVGEMVDQITSLKTLAYDRLMEANRVQLQYYQIQIRPHFFLNCLANLYGLSVTGDNTAVQEFILALSDYLRAVLGNHEPTIPLKEELTNVRYYLRLQDMISANAPEYVEEADGSLSDFRVPPMSILTFIENSLRYMDRTETRPEISIKIRRFRTDNESVVNISIMDSGTGFDEEVLKRLNKKNDWKPTEHIGIYNIQQRFALLYGDACTFRYSNKNGACVDIYISEESDESSGS